jgi:GxxExxY protein
MNELQQWVLEKCTDIVREIGAGHSESVYHNAFMVELRNSDCDWESEKVLPVNYKGIQVGFVKADIVIRGELVIEFKAITRKINDVDLRQVKKYMEICEIERGMVINFSRADVLNKTVEFLNV